MSEERGRGRERERERETERERESKREREREGVCLSDLSVECLCVFVCVRARVPDARTHALTRAHTQQYAGCRVDLKLSRRVVAPYTQTDRETERQRDRETETDRQADRHILT